MLDIHIYIAEFINAEDQFTYIHDALKTLNKMDFDKLIVAVPFALEQCLEILNDLLAWLPLNHQLKAGFATCFADTELL